MIYKYSNTDIHILVSARDNASPAEFSSLALPFPLPRSSFFHRDEPSLQSYFFHTHTMRTSSVSVSRDTQEAKNSLSLFLVRRTSECAKFARKSRRHRRQFLSYQWWTFNIAGIREIERYCQGWSRDFAYPLRAYLAYGKIRVCFMRRIYMGTFAKENRVLSRSAGKTRYCGWTKYFRIQTKIENRYRLRYNLGLFMDIEGERERERGTERNIKIRGGDKWTTSIQTRVRHRCSTRLTSLKRSSFQCWRVLNAIFNAHKMKDKNKNFISSLHDANRCNTSVIIVTSTVDP